MIPSFNGESVGHWEGDTLVVDTIGFVDDHHWLDSGIPLSDKTHMVERMRLLGDGATLDDVFRHYTGDTLDDNTEQGGIRDVRRARRTARRLG